MSSQENYKRAYEMQKKARAIAEKRLEDKSRELYVKNKDLENALEQLNKQQEKIIAQEKLASVGELAAELAHELNNPNAFIQNNLITLHEYVNQLLQSLDRSLETLDQLVSLPNLSDKKDRIIETITSIRKDSDISFIKADIDPIFNESLQGSKRIENIANSLRYFANPDISSKKLVNINECITQAKQLISNQSMQSIDIIKSLDNVPEILGIPLLLTQAISGILANAINSRPKSACIHVETSKTKTHVVIMIKDDGSGMSAEKLKSILNSLTPHPSTQKGLGLGIAQNIIHQHDGELFIQSIEGQGTTVTIELPLRKA